MNLIERRRFLTTLLAVPVLGRVLLGTKAARADAPASLQSFGYYEPLGETDEHDPTQTDGTTYNMPCIAAADIAAAVDKTYTFWHGHDGTDHLFTVTAAHFQQLQTGADVLVYTTMVEDHRHSLTISPSSPCGGGDAMCTLR